MGRTGWVRFRAWIWLFSSTHSTSAWSGGFRYRPTMSQTFSTKNGSVESLKLRVRCGWSAKAWNRRCCVRFGDATGAGRFPDSPLRTGGGLPRQRALQQSGDLLILDGARTSGAQLVIQAGQPMLNKTLAPFAHGGFGPAQPGCNPRVAFGSEACRLIEEGR